MGREASLVILLALSAFRAGAQSGIHELYVDIAATGLLPVTWATDSPTLAHLGFDALLGLEYDLPISVPIRFEAGYLRASASRISPSGELYRGWEGLRLALLSGYNFEPSQLGALGNLYISILGGGAITAADYTDTALAYAYPSIILEPRLYLSLRSAQYRMMVQGPSLAAPIELMFRAGTRTLAPALSFGWRYRLGAAL